ncbi:MAG: PilN domain-containing protein [Deltaproteobacteria bacterium]|nr:PilN domain-containing protein [Deltaproteobacteria bacterium]
MLNHKIRSLWSHISAEVTAGTASLGAFWDRQHLTLVRIQRNLTSIEVVHVSHFTLAEEGLKPLIPEIKELLLIWGLENAPVGLSVSPHMGFMRQVNLPRAAKENLDRVMSYELDRFLPLSAEQVSFDFQIVKETDTDLTITLMAYPQNLTESWLELCAETGLKPVSIELAPTSVANAFALLKKQRPAYWLLLQTGEQDFDIINIENNAVSYWHSERVPPGKKFLPALRQELKQLFQSGINPAALFIYGPRAAEIKIGLTEYLSFPVSRDSELEIKGLQLASENAPRILPAIGAACRGVGKVPIKTNLLPESERTEVKLTGLFLTRILLLLLGGLTLIWAGSAFIYPRISLMKVEGRLAELQPAVQQVEERLTAAQNLGKQLQDIQNRIEQSPSKLVILKELTRIIPEHTHLYSLRARKSQIELGGKSSSAADLIAVMEKSSYFTNTGFVSPIVTDSSGSEIFKIKTEIKSGWQNAGKAAPTPSPRPVGRGKSPKKR